MLGALLGRNGRVGGNPSDSVGDWQGLERGEEPGEAPRTEPAASCRC